MVPFIAQSKTKLSLMQHEQCTAGKAIYIKKFENKPVFPSIQENRRRGQGWCNPKNRCKMRAKPLVVAFLEKRKVESTNLTGQPVWKGMKKTANTNIRNIKNKATKRKKTQKGKNEGV